MLMDNGPPPSLTMDIPDGSLGVRETLKMMRDLAREGRKDPLVRQTACMIVQNLRQKDFGGEISLIFDFVYECIRYVRDIVNVETLHTAERILKQGQGDCDDKCIILASLLEAIGHPCKFVALAFQPGAFSHVIVETICGKDRFGRPRWIALDATENKPMGWYPPKVLQRMEIKI